MADPGRPNHQTALKYFREALRRGATLHLSTVVAAEFHVKQEISDLPLRNFYVEPFNIEQAMIAGDLWAKLSRDADDRRDVVKDDVKLIAQAIDLGLTHVLSEDASTLAKYAERLRSQGACELSVILLRDGFQSSHFEGGQLGFSDIDLA